MRFVPTALFATVVVLVAGACEGDAGPTSGPSRGSTGDSDDSTARAEAAAMRLGKTLRTRLEEAMRSGGPASAIAACASEAQAVGRQIERETGVRVGRSSLRLRNPADAPPEWVAAWLREQGERAAEGARGVRATVDGTGGKVVRVLRPIAVEAPCLSCHGAPSEIPPEVTSVLAAQYPGDTATGYRVGDLRGAVWAEAAVAP